MNAKLLIVSDLGRLKAYKFDTTLEGAPHLELLEEAVLEPAHHRFADEVTDLAGRRGSPTQRNWGAPLADDHNIQLETRRRLRKEIAGHIQRLAQSHPELGVWLAIQKEINYQILETLPGVTRQRIENNLPCDLVKAEKAELVKWFAPHLARRSAAR